MMIMQLPTFRSAKLFTLFAGLMATCFSPACQADESTHTDAPEHTIVVSPSDPGWTPLGEADFVRVNGDDQTLTWNGPVAHGSGTPIGVTRSRKTYKNFELLIEWRHERPAGNSGVFAWVPASALDDLPPGKLPDGGIEIQMLDHDYTRQWHQRTGGGKTPFFSTHGDVFAVGKSTMKPFPPLSPNGSRSFPSKERSLGAGQWNRYYVRGVNGTIRLWVNGEEVSGGSDCQPSEGYLCLESEGSPITFRNLFIRQLP
ncbi:hypothetical protein Mal65_21540 [Crateriforma conspicua]|nr:hypothetical protein Mal65_21540 [Crateriforma conspicua]